DLGGQSLVADLDHSLAIGAVGVSHRAFFDVLAGAAPQLLDVGQKRLVSHTALPRLQDHFRSAPKRVPRASYTRRRHGSCRRIPVTHMERRVIQIHTATISGWRKIAERIE